VAAVLYWEFGGPVIATKKMRGEQVNQSVVWAGATTWDVFWYRDGPTVQRR
jgi:hypothetical protein